MRYRKLQLLLMVVALVLLSVASLRAQLNYFVYLESENREPFYVRVQNKIHAAPSGHLILSKLVEGDLKLELGFPKTSMPEQQFSITIAKKDRGFLLRNFSDKGWVLYDLQESQLIAAVSKQAQAVVQPTASNVAAAVNDPFANMLAAVTQDSTVKQVTVQKEVQPVDTLRQSTQKPAVTGNVVAGSNKPATSVVQPGGGGGNKIPAAVDSPVVKPPTEPAQGVVKETVSEPNWAAPKKSMVELIARMESGAGYDLVFRVLEEDGRIDTVKLFIEGKLVVQKEINRARDTVVQQVPLQSDTLRAVVMPVQDTLRAAVGDTASIASGDTLRNHSSLLPEKNPEVKAEEKKDSVAVQAPQQQQALQPAAQVQQTPPASVPNSNCRQIAGEEDFIKLRRRMAFQKRDEEMVAEARKQFQQRCYSTAQLRALSILFMTDEWRYRFYDAALPFVSDFSNFAQLEATIQSEYFRKRFLALLPNN